MTDTVQHERDIVATDEMIRNLKAGTFKKTAIGAGVCGALLLTGASPLVWTYRHGNDPEMLKEALRHMPPLTVNVKLDPDSKVSLADGGVVRLADGSKVVLAEGGTVRLNSDSRASIMPRADINNGGGSHDPAIQETVVVFRRVTHGQGSIETGWEFADGAAKTPNKQWCHYKQTLGDGNSVIQIIGWDGKQSPAPATVKDQSTRFTKCQWFSGGLG